MALHCCVWKSILLVVNLLRLVLVCVAGIGTSEYIVAFLNIGSSFLVAVCLLLYINRYANWVCCISVELWVVQSFQLESLLTNVFNYCTIVD